MNLRIIGACHLWKQISKAVPKVDQEAANSVSSLLASYFIYGTDS